MTATRRNSLIAAVLIAATLFVYWPVFGFEFVDFDDDVYITDNPVVRSGLSARGVLWAFTSGHAANWHPLTWLSHMVDVTLFGLAAGAHHATNLLFHLANTLLVFLFFARTTGHTMTSAVVALFFGIHPLHVESVAWVSERKDVLSAFFGLGSLLFYAEWVTKRKQRDFVLSLCSFGAGLMAKPILVTLPFVLLLIDVWPLGRPNPATRQAIVSRLREKSAFFGLAIASSVVTVVVQRNWGAMGIGDAIAFPDRLANALVRRLAQTRAASRSRAITSVVAPRSRCTCSAARQVSVVRPEPSGARISPCGVSVSSRWIGEGPSSSRSEGASPAPRGAAIRQTRSR